MLKKLASLLFEEEEIVDEKPQEEKVDLRRVKKQPEPIEEPVKNPVIEQEPIEKPKRSSFETILADDVAPQSVQESPKTFVAEAKEPVRPSEPAFIDRKPVLSKEVYEFKPVISPMFGIAESEKEHVRPTFVQTAEVKNDSHLQTVISPYYGAIHKDLKTAPAQPVTVEPTAPVKAKVAEYVGETKAPVIENISLEELIKPAEVAPQAQAQPTEEPKAEEKPEDVTQFSLFGDN